MAASADTGLSGSPRERPGVVDCRRRDSGGRGFSLIGVFLSDRRAERIPCRHHQRRRGCRFLRAAMKSSIRTVLGAGRAEPSAWFSAMT